VLPIITETWDKPFVCVDIKGEIKREYDKCKPNGKTKVFSLTEESGNSYDLYDFLHQDGEKNLISNVCEIAQSLIPLPIDLREPFWVQSAQNFLTAAILYYFKLGLTFIDTAINIMTTAPGNLIEEIAESGNMQARIFVNNLIEEITDEDGNRYTRAISDSKMLAGISQEITNSLSIFATDPRVISALTPSCNQISWDDLENQSIFISVPEDRLEQYNPVLTMILTQLIRSLERRPEKHSPEAKPPVLLMLDEFPRLGKMNVITSALSTLRSKNVSICLVTQSLSQIDAIYGEKIRRIILDNCQYIAILSVTDAETQEYFSKIIGTKHESANSISINLDSTGRASTSSYQISDTCVPVIKPHQFLTLKNIILITPDGYCRIEKASYHRK
jgi:type IV secretion system protein VirD4